MVYGSGNYCKSIFGVSSLSCTNTGSMINNNWIQKIGFLETIVEIITMCFILLRKNRVFRRKEGVRHRKLSQRCLAWLTYEMKCFCECNSSHPKLCALKNECRKYRKHWIEGFVWKWTYLRRTFFMNFGFICA